VSFEEMQAIQADVVVRDGEVFTPYIVRAFDRALSNPDADAQLRALASDAGVAESRRPLAPVETVRHRPVFQKATTRAMGPVRSTRLPQEEVQASIAASLYAAWRSRMLASVINGTLGSLPGARRPGQPRRAAQSAR